MILPVEERWRNTWRDEDHYFDHNSKKPQFVIDTPSTLPTGNFHIGNALNWCYIDFFARYKRMKGYNVMFPQGWDCHGLPTEVKVEELNHITKNDVSREEFRRMCREPTEKNIEQMRLTLRILAFSTDWSNQYITMTPKDYSKTQLSFLRMLKSGDIYQDEHPVTTVPCARRRSRLRRFLTKTARRSSTFSISMVWRSRLPGRSSLPPASRSPFTRPITGITP